MLRTLLDPGRQREASEDQAALSLIKSHRLADSVPRANYLFGCSLEQKILSTILSDDFTAGGRERLNRLGEAYALQGRFEDAATITTDPAHQAAYALRARAMQSIGVRCACPAVVFRPSKTDAKGDRHVTQHKIEQVFDGSRIVTFFRCAECGALSAE